MSGTDAIPEFNKSKAGGSSEVGVTNMSALTSGPGIQSMREVLAIIPTANRDRATIQVRVGFKERDPRVLPQMAAKVTFDRSEAK